MYECNCGNSISYQRYMLGYMTCLECGEKSAIRDREHWTIAPLHKSCYTLISNPSELKGLNKSPN